MIKIGDKIPEFEGNSLVNGEEGVIKSSYFKGKKLVMYFYPKDLTPGCTVQACNLRDNFSEFENNNIVILGISKDSIKSHKNFITKKELAFILISDEDLKLNKLFGVWQLKKFMGKEYMGTVRTTFLFDEDQKLVKIIEKPKVKEHSKEILESFNL